MQVDITGLSEAGDVKFIGDSSFKIIDGSVVVSRSDSISSSSSEVSEDKMAFTANGCVTSFEAIDLPQCKQCLWFCRSND